MQRRWRRLAPRHPVPRLGWEGGVGGWVTRKSPSRARFVRMHETLPKTVSGPKRRWRPIVPALSKRRIEKIEFVSLSPLVRESSRMAAKHMETLALSLLVFVRRDVRLETLILAGRSLVGEKMRSPVSR